MNQKKWRPVQLPRKLVDRIEIETKKPNSLYRNISDYISTLIRQELKQMKESQN